MIPIAALMLGSQLLLIADRPPQFDPRLGCRSVADSAGSTGRRSEDCVNDELHARDVLQQSWGEFSAADKSHCDTIVRTGGQPSYVELLSCLEMSRDARNLATDRDKPGASKLDKQPRQR